MLYDSIITFLFSISPFGEARVGIPYGALNGLPVILALVIGLSANLLVYPLFYRLIRYFNKTLWTKRWYKKSAIYLTKKAKRGTQEKLEKYGAWGLMVFVMIPLPVTGAYIGTLAAYVMGIPYKKAFIAVSVGVTISSILIATGLYFGMKTF